MVELLATNITAFVSVAIVIMLLLAISFLIAFNISQNKKLQYQQSMVMLKEMQQNELIKAAVLSEETERHRISEELHDEVGALLSATKLYLGNLQTDEFSEINKTIHSKSLELLDDSIIKVRSISHNLHSAILKELGINEAIQSFFQKLGQAGSFDIEVNLDKKYENTEPERDISVYRIIQELSNNIIKYSKGNKLKISSTFDDSSIAYIIEHNGTGLTQEEFERLRYEGKGLGLKNIQNRIILLKGSILFEKNNDAYTIHLTIPINA